MRFWKFNKFKYQQDPSIIHINGLPEVNNWTVSEFILNKIVPIVGIHPYPLSELQFMISAVCWLKPSIIIEWGTHIGVSARIFSEAIESFGYNSRIFSIDLPPEIYHIENPKNERGKMVTGKKNVQLLLGDCVQIAKKLSLKYKKDKVLFFLDGDHEYKSVIGELKMIHQKFSNASILLHDTFMQNSSSRYNVGPCKAIKEFMSENKKQYMIMSTVFGLPGMTLLIKKNGKS